MTVQISSFSADGFGKFGALDVEETGMMKQEDTLSVLLVNMAHSTETSESSSYSGYSDHLSVTWSGTYRKSGTLYQPL